MISFDFLLQTREDVLKIGIAEYNQRCRGIVMRFSKEWEATVKRMGRWIDFENDYKTMNPSFMESVWWVFGQLFEKNLVYRGYKVMPYSTGCATPLSNFEAGQNYKEVNDPAGWFLSLSSRFFLSFKLVIRHHKEIDLALVVCVSQSLSLSPSSTTQRFPFSLGQPPLGPCPATWPCA